MKYLMLLILNIFDGAATCIGMGLGHLSEANPILAGLSPIGILGVKLIPINILILVLYKTKDRKLSRYGAILAIIVYVFIFQLHVAWIVGI